MKSIRLISMLFVLILSVSVTAEENWRMEQTQGSLEFVKLGYGDMNGKNYRSLNFVTECLETDQITQIIPVVKNYNAFDGAKVADAVGKFRGLVDCYEFGRAGSPILHINIPHWTHQREYYEGPIKGKKISDTEVEVLINEFKEVFVGRLGADEYGRDSIMERKVYFWWD